MASVAVPSDAVNEMVKVLHHEGDFIKSEFTRILKKARVFKEGHAKMECRLFNENNPNMCFFGCKIQPNDSVFEGDVDLIIKPDVDSNRRVLRATLQAGTGGPDSRRKSISSNKDDGHSPTEDIFRDELYVLEHGIFKGARRMVKEELR
ncbi:hypothetical protein JXA85_01720 [Candidatus Woesearchaeota archaeon]|nr:hypothetical protein [Candidatus Woesearchaeota archaeon]